MTTKVTIPKVWFGIIHYLFVFIVTLILYGTLSSENRLVNFFLNSKGHNILYELPFPRKTRAIRLHLNPPSLVWMSICFSKFLLCVKFSSHCSYLNFFLPLFFIICLSKFSFVENSLSHCLHLNFLSPVWTIMCLNKMFIRVNFVSHYSHSNFLSSVWTTICHIKLPFIV